MEEEEEEEDITSTKRLASVLLKRSCFQISAW
jgi:hypothetical protein